MLLLAFLLSQICHLAIHTSEARWHQNPVLSANTAPQWTTPVAIENQDPCLLCLLMQGFDLASPPAGAVATSLSRPVSRVAPLVRGSHAQPRTLSLRGPPALLSC